MTIHDLTRAEADAAAERAELNALIAERNRLTDAIAAQARRCSRAEAAVVDARAELLRAGVLAVPERGGQAVTA